jgi:hypothetical protein
MSLKTKKIIAREFLLFLLCITITGFVGLGTYLYNSCKINKVEVLKKEITLEKIIADSLQRSISIEYDEYGIPIKNKLPPPIMLELASKRKLIQETTTKLEKYSVQVLSSTEQIRLSLIIFLISLSCVFLFRYLFYGIRWSLTILKEK